MLPFPSSVRIYLAEAPCDIRKSFDGLSALVLSALGLDPLSGHLFVFLNRQRDRVKILFWSRGGFVLYYKRLERGVFRLPARLGEARAVELDATDLTMLLDGIDLGRVRRPPLWQPPAPAP